MSAKRAILIRKLMQLSVIVTLLFGGTMTYVSRIQAYSVSPWRIVKVSAPYRVKVMYNGTKPMYLTQQKITYARTITENDGSTRTVYKYSYRKMGLSPYP